MDLGYPIAVHPRSSVNYNKRVVKALERQYPFSLMIRKS